jgi:3,4-dihydroxy 2-butanone 4-phosphate synthase/GTP cyclohydrolase II
MVAVPNAVTIDSLAVMTRHGCGLLEVLLSQRRVDYLFGIDRSRLSTADLRGHSSPGSAADRLATIRALADPDCHPASLLTPGHVLVETGDDNFAKVSMRLAGAAGGGEACLVCPVIGADHPDQLDIALRLARRRRLCVIDVESAGLHLESEERRLHRRIEAQIPTQRAVYQALGYADHRGGREHIAMLLGDPTVPGFRVHIHRRCLTDVFGGGGCACGAALRRSLAEIEAAGEGAVIYGGELDLTNLEQHLEPVAGPAAGPHSSGDRIAEILLDLGATSVLISANIDLDEHRLEALGIQMHPHEDGAKPLLGACA